MKAGNIDGPRRGRNPAHPVKNFDPRRPFRYRAAPVVMGRSKIEPDDRSLFRA
jgi:hypothetical protein